MAETVREYVVTIYGPIEIAYNPWGACRYGEHDVRVRAYTAADAIAQASVSLRAELLERVVRVVPVEQ